MFTLKPIIIYEDEFICLKFPFLFTYEMLTYKKKLLTIFVQHDYQTQFLLGPYLSPAQLVQPNRRHGMFYQQTLPHLPPVTSHEAEDVIEGSFT